MVSCSVLTCRNKGAYSKNKIDGITYHKFPRDPPRKRAWLKSINKADSWIPTKNSVICSLHFEEKYFYYSAKGRRLLMDNAVPSLFLPAIDTLKTTSTQTDLDVFNYILLHEQETIIPDITFTSVVKDEPVTNDGDDFNTFCETGISDKSSRVSTPLSFYDDSPTTMEINNKCEEPNVDTDTPLCKLANDARRYKVLFEKNRMKVKCLSQCKRRNKKTIDNLRAVVKSLQEEINQLKKKSVEDKSAEKVPNKDFNS